jgi:hypothetical protein
MIEKIFKAYDVRATYPNPLNEMAWRVGRQRAVSEAVAQGLAADHRAQ